MKVIATVVAIPLLLITLLIVFIGSDSGISCAAIPDGVGGPTGSTLAGFGERQLALARDGVAIGKKRGEPADIIIAELAAQATESAFRNLANSNVPESLGFSNDGVGSDSDSVGPHQMRVSVWGSVGMATLMSPDYQINWFYDQAGKLGPRTTMLGPAELAQAIEDSASNAYSRNLDLARQVYNLFAGVDVGSCRSTEGGALAVPVGPFGAAVIAAAQRWIGMPYVWGGGDTQGPTNGGFDCSGLVLYAVYQASAGRITLPHYTQAQQDDPRGHVVPFDQRQPGDLIYFTKPGEHDSHHVGVYLGQGQLLNAPAAGQRIKIEPLSDWAGERLDVRRFQP